MHANDNLTTDRPTFVTHLECGLDGDRYDADTIQMLSKAGRPLLVRYDLTKLAETVSQQELATRPPDMWRYREFLPVRRTENIVSLGECHTPLIRLPKLEAGPGQLIVKDEGRLPTGSGPSICLFQSLPKSASFRVGAASPQG